jgi:3'-5' exonuclease
MNGSVIVWDLETVPDLRGFTAANGLAGKTDEEVREAIGDKFPKHIYHSIVCIGALLGAGMITGRLRPSEPRTSAREAKRT